MSTVAASEEETVERERRGPLPNIDCPACCPDLHVECRCKTPRCTPHWIEHGLNPAERDARNHPDRYLEEVHGN